jgi:hypothetical protein
MTHSNRQVQRSSVFIVFLMTLILDEIIWSGLVDLFNFANGDIVSHLSAIMG